MNLIGERGINEVEHFASKMMKTLNKPKNAEKGGLDVSVPVAKDFLKEEFEEVRSGLNDLVDIGFDTKLDNHFTDCDDLTYMKQVRDGCRHTMRECVDLAITAMMLWRSLDEIGFRSHERSREIRREFHEKNRKKALADLSQEDTDAYNIAEARAESAKVEFDRVKARLGIE